MNTGLKFGAGLGIGTVAMYVLDPDLKPTSVWRKKSMPKDPKRNIQSYQLQGGNLNKFEFQKSQSEMAEESDLPFAVETDTPNVSQAKRVAEVTAEAHRKVEKRRKRGIAKSAQGRSWCRLTSSRKTRYSSSLS